jgi:hypothetical protein
VKFPNNPYKENMNSGITENNEIEVIHKKYRTLSVVEDNGIKGFKEDFSEIGPGIRKIYWIQFTYNWNEQNSKNINLADKYGYYPLKTFHYEIFDKKHIALTFWVANDYRLNEKVQHLCNLCKMEKTNPFIRIDKETKSKATDDNEKKLILKNNQNENTVLDATLATPPNPTLDI